ncbi:MAG TPA: hypothetical protein PKC28_03050 [Bdellovibrionales bacterium]|nr:hypothetical protein [Bdellovibrionales bacterium]
MKSLVRIVAIGALMLVTQSCSDVKFHSDKSGGPSGQSCEPNCPTGTTYAWTEGGYGLCSLPCGGGTQTQVVECRRLSDGVTVADSLCTGPKPATSQTCHTQSCVGSFSWNIGNWGSCSVTCGPGTRTRNVLCQDNNNGNTVNDSNCPQPKPVSSQACPNQPTCPAFTYQWKIVPGVCSKQCGGGTAQDTVYCLRSDGAQVADGDCSANGPKPSEAPYACNTQACPTQYTYSWEPGAWSACSVTCGAGTQTRSASCKRSDGAYVPTNYCDAGTKPATSRACPNQPACPNGNQVTQVETVPVASNSVDVILIVDDSSSMKEDQTKLANRMIGLVNNLDALNIDYQICLTTTDIDYYKGSPIKWAGTGSYILKKSTANKDQVFKTTIDALGAGYSSDEQGIKGLYLMIKDYRASGCIRDKATLTTILVSDENERSVGGNASWSSAQYKPLTPQNYPDFLINYVKTTFNTPGFTKPFIYNSIIVKPYDTACEAAQDAQSSPSFFGTLYAELSNKTMGHIGSICDSDYSQNLQYIKDRVVNSMPGITLQCVPVGNPTVTFDRPVNTSVSVIGKEMKFTPALPEGVKVTIVYTCP